MTSTPTFINVAKSDLPPLLGMSYMGAQDQLAFSIRLGAGIVVALAALQFGLHPAAAMSAGAAYGAAPSGMSGGAAR